MGNSDKLFQVARFNPEFNKILKTSYEAFMIYQSKGLLTHLLKRKHYVAAKYIDNIPEIIRKPDYIGTYNSSIEFVKCYKDNIFISVKLDTKRNKYYVATAYEVKQGKIESYVKSGRLNKVGINVLD